MCNLFIYIFSCSHLCQLVCNKPDGSPAAGLSSDSNGRAALRLNEYGVMAEKKACGESPGDEGTKRRHFVWNSVDANALVRHLLLPHPPFFGDTLFLRFNG